LRRRASTLAAALVFFAAALACASAEGPTPVPPERPNPRATVQPCTAVPVKTLDDVDSGRAKPGDFFRFQTLAPTTDGGKEVVIPAHTLGYGVVALSVPAGKQGRSGALVLQPLYLKMQDGSQLGVVLDYGATDMGKQGKNGELVPGYVGLIPVPGLAYAIGAVNYFHHGKDISVPKGTPFSIFPENDPKSAFCQP
jgi:hypothetical protein